MSAPTLDYCVVENEGEWQVWTPDMTGAVIGSGPSKDDALLDAMDNLDGTRQAMLSECSLTK